MSHASWVRLRWSIPFLSWSQTQCSFACRGKWSLIFVLALSLACERPWAGSFRERCVVAYTDRTGGWEYPYDRRERLRWSFSPICRPPSSRSDRPQLPRRWNQPKHRKSLWSFWVSAGHCLLSTFPPRYDRHREIRILRKKSPYYTQRCSEKHNWLLFSSSSEWLLRGVSFQTGFASTKAICPNSITVTRCGSIGGV